MLNPEGGLQPSHTHSSCQSIRFREQSPCRLSFSVTPGCGRAKLCHQLCLLLESVANSPSPSAVQGAALQACAPGKESGKRTSSPGGNPVLGPRHLFTCSGYPHNQRTFSGRRRTHIRSLRNRGGQRSLVQPHKSPTAPSQEAPFPPGTELCDTVVLETPPCGTSHSPSTGAPGLTKGKKSRNMFCSFF